MGFLLKVRLEKMVQPLTLKMAQDLCATITKEHYENFPVGRFVTKDLRPHIQAIYAFARTADDFADEAQFEGQRLALLEDWRKKLFEAKAGEASDPVFIALAHTLSTTALPVQWLEDLIRAFEQDVIHPHHATWDSITEYASRSANPVGRLVLWLHGYRSEDLFELSDAICSALQFTNFWQDIAVDLKKNRIYLPTADQAQFGYTGLSAALYNEAFVKLLAHEVHKTRDLFLKGRPLCDQVSGLLKFELRLVWLGGMRILEKIENVHFNVFDHRPTLNALDWALLLFRALEWKK